MSPSYLLGQVLLYCAIAVSWIFIGFYAAYYEGYAGTRLLAIMVVLLYGAVTAAIASKYMSSLSDLSRDLAQVMFFVSAALALACAAYDLYLRSGGKPLGM
jgi:hypothetical protein